MKILILKVVRRNCIISTERLVLKKASKLEKKVFKRKEVFNQRRWVSTQCCLKTSSHICIQKKNQLAATLKKLQCRKQIGECKEMMKGIDKTQLK